MASAGQGAPQRRASPALLGGAVLLLAGGALVLALDGPTIIVATCALSFVLLIVLQVVRFVRPRDAAAQAQLDDAWGSEEEVPVLQELRLEVRCSSCGTRFEVEEGPQALQAPCPGCGRIGLLRRVEFSVVGVKEPAAPPAAPARRLRVRCGRCRAIATVQDAGQRPLRHRCAACGTLGQLRA